MWVGIPGLRCRQMVGIINNLVKCLGNPTMVLIHCGGNDIGLFSSYELIFDMNFALYVISKMLPGTKIVFSSILPRNIYRYSDDLDAMDRTRRRVNRGVRRYIMLNNAYVIYHPDFNDSYKGLFKEDQVHLSYIGNDIFINTIQEALLQILLYPHRRVYPLHYA